MRASRILVSAACMLAVGCASTQTVTLPAPDPEMLDKADAVVVSAGGRGALNRPEGIVRGAGEGAGVAVGDWAGGAGGVPYSGDPAAGAAAVALWLVAFPLVAAIGAGRAHSAEEVDAAKQTFASIARDPALLPSLEPRVAEAIRRKAPNRWSCVAARSEDTADPCADAEAPATLEIRASYAPWMEGRYDPDVAIGAMVEATLTSPSGEIHTMRWRYDTAPRAFFDLTARGGAPLRQEIETMLDRLAQTIARELVVDPKPETVEVWAGGMEFEFTGPEYRQANAPAETSPGVVRRMHPAEPTPFALERALKATVVGERDAWGLGACRIAEVDGRPPRPPLANTMLLPGKSSIATAAPGEHSFTIRCPGAGEKNWQPREITAAVEAGRVYCTDGESFRDVTGQNSC